MAVLPTVSRQAAPVSKTVRLALTSDNTGSEQENTKRCFVFEKMKWSAAGSALSSYTSFTGKCIAGNNVYVQENNHLNTDKYGDRAKTDMKIGANIDAVNLSIRKQAVHRCPEARVHLS